MVIQFRFRCNGVMRLGAPSLCQHDVAVFLITGRKEWEKSGMEDGLAKAHYSGWTRLILRPGDKDKDVAPLPKDSSFPSPSAASYKAAARAGLPMEGYNVVVNVGDGSMRTGQSSGLPFARRSRVP